MGGGDWKDGLIAIIPKKGDLRDCNYRGIMLLSTPGKVLNRIILERLRKGVDDELRENQAGFRNGRSCSDQIATLRIIIEQSIEWNTPAYVNFIDFEKAFDSVAVMGFNGTVRKPPKLHQHHQEHIPGHAMPSASPGKGTRNIHCAHWGKTGLPASFLFLLCIDWTMKQTTNNKKTQMGSDRATRGP